MQSVDEWIARQDVKLDRSEAIRRLVELGLKVKKMMAFTINIAESNFRHTQRTSARATVKPATFPEPRFYLDASICWVQGSRSILQRVVPRTDA
jgi:hypothetical protein